MADFQYGIFAAFGIAFHKIIITDTTSYDTQFFVRTVHITIVRRFLGGFDEFFLALQENFVTLACVARQEDKLARIVAESEVVLRLLCFVLYAGT